MSKLTIPGNGALEAAIRSAAARGALGQSFLLTGEGDLTAAARFLAAALQCGAQEPPCGVCNACRKVMENIHPDVITVADPERKTISIDLLRQVRKDAWILPNEGRRKVYIFPDCSLLDPKSQNVLLKVAEEGPEHGVFLFCAENEGQVLPTIRSRCLTWRVAAEEEALSASPQAQELCALLERRNLPGLTAFFSRLESGRCKREELQQLLEEARRQLIQTLVAGGRDRRRLAAQADILEEAVRQLQFNLNVGHVCGGVSVALARSIRS